MTLQRQAKHQTSESSRKPQLFLVLILEYIFLCGVTCIFLQGHNHHLRSTLSKVLRHSVFPTPAHNEKCHTANGTMAVSLYFFK